MARWQEPPVNEGNGGWRGQQGPGEESGLPSKGDGRPREDLNGDSDHLTLCVEEIIVAVKGQGGKQGGLREYFQFEEQTIELTFPL